MKKLLFRPTHLPLTKTLFVVGILGIALSSYATLANLKRQVKRGMLKSAEFFATEMVHDLSKEIQTFFFTPLENSSAPIDWNDPKQEAAFRKTILAAIQSFKIDRFQFFDLNGKLAFCTGPRSCGLAIP